MRCPKCGESFVVNKPGGGAPAGGGAAGPGGPPPRKPPPPPRPSGGGAPTPPPDKAPLFGSSGGGSGKPPPRRKGAPTAIAGSINIPALADIGSDGGDDGFGVLDMSLPTDGGGGVGDDLPMAADHADLPMPAPQADLPMPAYGNPAPGAPPMPADDNLPRPAGAGLPAVAHGSDLPVPVAGADLPMPAHYHDLPVPADHGDLPVPAAHGDLPSPAAHGDLPLPAEFGDLPFPTDGDLPAPVDADLPMPHLHGDLPVPNDQDLPLPSAGGDLPLPADQDFPLPAPNGDLPLPADFNLPESASGDLPMAMDEGYPARGEQNFLQDGQFPSDGEFGALASEPPRAAPPRREGAGVGDEFAIDEVDESGLASEIGDAGPDGPRIPLKKKKRRKNLRIAAAALIAVGVGGGLLSLTSLGPYGAYAISDVLNADAHQSAVAAFRQSAQDQLGTDTASEASALFERAKNELSQMPRYKPMAGYAAYLAFQNIIRFGPDSATLASAKQIMVDHTPDGDMGALASAAQSAVDGNYADAQTKLAPLAQRLSDDIDVQVLNAELALLQGNAKEAVTAWQSAVSTSKSARTLYGLSRAQLAANDKEAAKKSAEEVLKLSKNHAGARIVLATLLWKANRADANAVKHLTEITKAGAVKSASSSAEQVDALALLGTIHLSLSRMTEAEKAFKAALQVDPKSVRALVGNGELFYVAGRYSEALARFKAAREVQAHNVSATVGIGKTLIKLERSKDAQAELKKAAKVSNHPLLGYWLGQSQEVLTDRKGAEATYRATIKAFPKHRDTVFVYVALSDLLSARGNPDEANKVLADAAEKLKKSAALYNAKGDVALKGGRINEAMAEFNKALELEPDNSQSRFKLAVAHRRARDFSAAKAELDKLQKSDPNFPGLMLEQGLLLQMTGKTDEALKIYSDALDKAPDDLDLKLRVGSVQVISGFPNKAKVLLEQVHTKRPRSAEVNHYYGRALLAADDNAQGALSHLKLAATLDASRADYHLWVAIAANELRDWSLAEKSVNMALELDKNYAEAYWQQGVTLQKRGKTKDALEVLLIALDKNPTLYEAQASIARCYQDQANAASAEEAWRKALKGDDTVAEWHFRLAKLMVNRNAKEEALPHLRKAVDLVKDDTKPGWLWNANYLLAEGLRNRDPERALKAYKAFVKLTNSENAYRADAETAIREIERDLRNKELGKPTPKDGDDEDGGEGEDAPQ